MNSWQKHLGNNDFSPGMHKDGDCKQLITKTAGALTNDVLRLLLVSVQQNNIDLSMFNAVN
jgi:hypothetical protein